MSYRESDRYHRSERSRSRDRHRSHRSRSPKTMERRHDDGNEDLDRWEMGDSRRSNRDRVWRGDDDDYDSGRRDRSHRDEGRSSSRRDGQRRNGRRGDYADGDANDDDGRRGGRSSDRDRGDHRDVSTEGGRQNHEGGGGGSSSADDSKTTVSKPKSGIFQYLNVPPLAGAAATGGVSSGSAGQINIDRGSISSSSSSARASTSTSTSSSVNTAALARVMADDKRAGDRNDRRRLAGAEARLKAVGSGGADRGGGGGDHGGREGGDWDRRGGGGGDRDRGGVGGDRGARGGDGDRGGGGDRSGAPVHLKTVKTATTSGARLRDSYSHGMRPDVASEKSLPYECDLCAATAKAPPKPPPSFLTATQLSDHLERRHNVRRHPSIIRPTKKASAPAAAAAAESCGGGTGWGVDGGGDAERDEQDLNL